MADDGSFNSMQAQLGLVGGSSSFNPLGIATPAPPPPPMVRHPGEVSTDIVRQTQTQMATTLQTTSAMRLGGMGGVAFGGGGGGGPGGIGAIGAFAHQYQQNMLGINQQHVGAFSAQMMGNMSGMGGGFQPGMMPHPAMMTAPGMGIYRPFPQQQGPTVSPFPQMPMFQTPFTPMPPPPQFQTPLELSNNMAIQAGQRHTAAAFATPGVVARGAADVGVGYMGAGVGAAIGARFGPMGALIGGGLGMAAGAFGSEHFGMGAAAQNVMDRINPFRTQAIRGQQMLAASQDFVGSGPDLNMMTGRGLSTRGANQLGRRLEETADSTRFQRETGGAFSAQDLTKITHVAGQQGLMNDAQSVDQIHDRVKGIAKSLVSFMKIANEPNVVEALKSMGRMRQMGLSMGETMDMAMEARQYSRMAGTSVRGIMETGGAQGAMIFQQQGLSAGLGMRMGMGAMGTAQSAVASGTFSAQRLGMLGGVQGVAQHEMESSAAFLKQPMMAMAMSKMGAGGTFKLDAGALQGMMSGRMDIPQMASRGVNNLLGAVDQHGRGALAMAQLQSTEISDSIGRALGPRGVEMAKMNQIGAMRKFLGGDKNPGGFVEAAKAMGMTDDQVKVMMDKANSPGYFEDQKRHIQIRKMEVRGMEAEQFERNRPTFMERNVTGDTALGRAGRYSSGAVRDMGEGLTNFFTDMAQDQELSKVGQFSSRTDRRLLMSNDELRYAKEQGLSHRRGPAVSSSRGGLGGISDAVLGVRQDTRQYYANQGGVLGGLFGGQGGGSALVGDVMAVGARLLGPTGLMASPAEMERANEATGKQDAEIASGRYATAEERATSVKNVGAGGSAAVVSLSRGIAKLADAKKNFFGSGGKIDPADVDKLIADEEKKTGRTYSAQEKSELRKTAFEMARASSKNKDAFAGSENVNMRKSLATKENLASEQESVVNKALGDTAWFNKEGRQKLVESALGGSEGEHGEAGIGSKSGAYAALLSAAQDNPDDTQLQAAVDAMSKELTDMGPEGQRIMAAARTKKEKAEKDNTIGDLRKLGVTLNKDAAGDTTKVFKAAKELKDTLVGNKAAAKQSAGYAALTGKSASDFSGKSGAEILDQLAGEDTSQLSEDAKAALDAYRAEKDPGKKAEIAAKFEELGLDTGHLDETEAVGGKRASTDKAAAAAKSGIVNTQQAMNEMFPKAVSTFSEASQALLDAANKLGGSVDKTSLGVPAETGAY